MSEDLGVWLRRQREARRWTRREMARQLILAGRATGDTSMPGIDSVHHNIQRWERGHGDLSERYKLHYCHALAIPPDQFGADPRAPHTGSAPGTAFRTRYRVRRPASPDHLWN